MFDPWQGTLEEALMEPYDPGDDILMSPGFRWSMAQRVLDRRSQIDGGDGRALLESIRDCGEYQLTIPPWLAALFSQAIRKVAAYEARSWDDVFGKPHPKSIRLEDQAARHRLGPVVAYAVLRAHRDDLKPLDDGLFEEIGERFNIGKTKCSELYRDFKDTFKDMR